jgi:hypothetical protein
MTEAEYKFGLEIVHHTDEWVTDPALETARRFVNPSVPVLKGNDWGAHQPKGRNGRRPRLYKGESLTSARPNSQGSPAQKRVHYLDSRMRSCEEVGSIHGSNGRIPYVVYGPEALSNTRARAAQFASTAVVGRETTIYGRNPNLFAVELVEGGPITVEDMFDAAEQIAAGRWPEPPIDSRAREYVYTAEVSTKQFDSLGGLPLRLPSFEPLDPAVTERLGLDSSVIHYPIVWDRLEVGERTGYVAELVTDPL